MRGPSVGGAETLVVVGANEDMDHSVWPDVLLRAWNFPSMDATRTMSRSSRSCGDVGGRSSWWGGGVSGERWTSAWEFVDESARHDAESTLNKMRAVYRRYRMGGIGGHRNPPHWGFGCCRRRWWWKNSFL